MPTVKPLTVKFIYAAKDKDRMDPLSRSLALEVLDPDAAQESRCLKMDQAQEPEEIEITFGIKPSLPLADAFSLIEDRVRAVEDVVMATISTGDEDLITVIHRNAIQLKAPAIAS